MAPTTKTQERDEAEEERQRVVADVAGLEEAQEVAGELDEEGGGVQDAVDDEDVHDLPEARGRAASNGRTNSAS